MLAAVGGLMVVDGRGEMGVVRRTLEGDLEVGGRT